MLEAMIDTWNAFGKYLGDHLDVIASVSSLIAAAGCVYLSAVILKERIPLVDAQRWSLGGLAVALVANSLYDFPQWMLINGHRPTGVAVDFMLMIYVGVTVVRGAIFQPHRKREDSSGQPGALNRNRQ